MPKAICNLPVACNYLPSSKKDYIKHCEKAHNFKPLPIYNCLVCRVSCELPDMISHVRSSHLPPHLSAIKNLERYAENTKEIHVPQYCQEQKVCGTTIRGNKTDDVTVAMASHKRDFH